MLIGLYLASLIFGTLLFVVSLIGAGDHGDHGDHPGSIGDHDLTVGHEAHGALTEGLKFAAMPLLSLRFWTFFAATFGVTGLLLAAIGLPWFAHLAIALPCGLAIGGAVAWMFRRLQTDLVTGEVDTRKLIGQEARVMLSIRPGDLGKIVLASPSGRLELPARTRDAHALAIGSRVLVADIEGGTAEVTSLPDP